MTDGERGRERTGRIDQTRVVVGGAAILLAVLGYAAMRAVVAAAALPETWVVLALPVFGVVAVVGLAFFVTGVIAGANASE